MKKVSQSFQEILEEKLNNKKSEEIHFSTTRTKIEENIPIFFANFPRRIKNPLGKYPQKTISRGEKLQFWLEKCQSSEEKLAVHFFFQHGETDFINTRSLTKSFRKLALKLHPDRFMAQESSVIDQKKSEFIELQRHYSILKKLAKAA